jgi:hypothetical protein
MSVDLVAAIAGCRKRASSYLENQIYESGGKRFWRNSPGHDPAAHPQQLLYGTWAGAMASVLIGIDGVWTTAERGGIGRALGGFQRPDGLFWMDCEPSDGHDPEYMSFHCTNYSLGALRAIGEPAPYPLSFLRTLATRSDLAEWLRRRDMTQPWKEGNNIVNLASFYLMAGAEDRGWASERLEDLIAWHNANQNGATGFWHAGGEESKGGLLNAMAGGAHNLHIYYQAGREVPRLRGIIDTCLRFGYLGVRSACIDLDMVDILVHARRAGYRLAEIDRILIRYVAELLQVQNGDGGFADSYVIPQNTYGQRTPAGISVTWTTWFRLVTIGLIAGVLWPAAELTWTFRKTIGMGYGNLEYGAPPVEDAVRLPRASLRGHERELLAAIRELRFLRQRLTWHARRGIATLRS